jgi:hypothetical protein
MSTAFRHIEIEESVMGECCAGSKCNQSDQQTCEKIGGDYYPNGRGTCYLAGLLQDYIERQTGGDPLIILSTAGTFAELYDAVDIVLPRMGVGPQILEYYADLTPKMLPVLRGNDELFQNFYRVYLAGMIFIRQFLRIELGLDILRARYTQSLHDDLRMVLRSFIDVAAGQGVDIDQFEQPFQFLELLTEQFVGMDPAEIYEQLRNPEVQSA